MPEISVTEQIAKHTPGPWIVEPIPPDAHTDPDVHIDEDSAFWIAEARQAGEVIALVQITPREPLQAAANGHLIAAAPALLASLRRLTYLCAREGWTDYATDGETALAQAEGRS